MFASASLDDDGAASIGQSLNVCALVGYAALVFTDAELPRPSMQGTVGASVQAASDEILYRRGSDILIMGTPVSPKRAQVPVAPRQLRARELIAELHTINAQIHQIMSQVERAMSRLASSG